MRFRERQCLLPEARWTDIPTLHILPHWNWQGKEGKLIDVWAYSNCDQVELFLNKKSLGKQDMKINSHLEWKVAYAPGTLEAIGYKNGKQVMRDVVKTTGEASAIRLTGHQAGLKANAEDIVIVTVAVDDKAKTGVPTAGNEIAFSLKGPGKIIGVGNGDPVSLEKDRFIEEITTVKLSGVKEKELANISDGKALLETDDSTWKEAFTGRNYKKLPVAYIHRATFNLPADLTGQRLTLFFNSIGKEQSIYINGKAVDGNLTDNHSAYEFLLNDSVLRPGKNKIDIIALPLTKKYDWDVVNTDPGTIQIYRPADQWKRKLFNGLAQIIIQSTGEAGEIVLSATSPGLKTGVLKVTSVRSANRMASK